MIFALIVAAQAVTPVDCSEIRDSVASLKCEIVRLPKVDCDEPITQMEINVCSYREYLEADIALNEHWARVRSRWHERSDRSDFWQKVFGAQREWLEYRNAECEVWKKLYGGGTISPLMQNSCLTKVTQQRVEKLAALLDTPQ